MSLLRACKQAYGLSRQTTPAITSSLRRFASSETPAPAAAEKVDSDIVPAHPDKDILAADAISGAPGTTCVRVSKNWS